MKSVLIIGSGFAGLSAAVRLSQSGYLVTVVEQRRILGGRAYSIPSGPTREWVDNGQHALLAAFHETRKFLRSIGTEELVKFQERFEVTMVEAHQRIRIRSFPLPAPFHLGIGVLACRSLSWLDRFHLIRAGLIMTLTRKLDKDLTVAEWMGKLKQPDSLCQRWWYPLSTAALNELPHRASARLFLRVMRDTFFGRSMDSSFGIMTVSLGELYTSQSAEMIKASGGDVRVSSPVLKLHFSEKLARSVEFQDGQHSSADYFISAVPPNALSRILPDALKNNGMEFSNLNQLTGSPIISIHLWYDREVMEEDFIGLIGSPIHWVFNKSRLWIHGKDYGGAIACVISGAYDLIDSPPAKLIELSQRELARYLPGVKKAKLERNRLIKEREATFSCTPEAEKYRVPQETPFNNFFVAGDWTDTGLPATIESAVLSGHRCADLIIKST